jgi:hypothetical protein
MNMKWTRKGRAFNPAQLAAWVSWYAGSLDNIPG